jgi:hypothetical protein
MFLVRVLCGAYSNLVSRDGDLLLAGPSGVQIPVEARFSAPVPTGPGANPTSYTAGTMSFPEVKRPGRGVDHQPPLIAGLKKE